MDPRFLEQADENLRVYQVYRTLDLNRHFLPRQFLYAFVALTLIFLSLMVLVGAWISARLTAPVSALLTGMEEIGRGNLDFRLPEPTGKDETARLIKHFNRMAAALQENQQRLIYLEKMAMWQQIARKLAHEIKNPLTPIQLTLQQLVDQYDDSNPQYRELLQECSQIINEEIGSLRRLVTEFSRFGRMPELKVQPGDLNQLIQEVSSLYGERIQLNLEDSLPALPFDRDRLRRVLINLIANAIQADPQGQPIRIQTRRQNGMVEITVSDKGKGIPPDHLQRIFEPYFSTRKEGMGLGLAITRMIVEEHHGEIRVESRPGEGTTFFIRLPIKGTSDSGGHHATRAG
jgi:nitrogen fixation/metabolism regulation signal transduction histidine kinase